MATIPEQPTLAVLQQFINDICIERGWDKRTPLEKMLFLTEEVGELAKEVRRQYGTYGYEAAPNHNALAEELIDVLNYVIDIANCYDVDLNEAFQAKWQKTSGRTWHGNHGN